MNRLTRRYGVPAPHFSGVLIDACQSYAWPGNLRELQIFVKRFLVPSRHRHVSLVGEQALTGLLRGNFIMCPTLCYRRSVLGARNSRSSRASASRRPSSCKVRR